VRAIRTATDCSATTAMWLWADMDIAHISARNEVAAKRG
jgi:hypothetical protein